MNEYELMVVLHPRLNTDEAGVMVETIQSQIGEAGGELLSTDVWGRRRLAYPIEGVLEGTYVLYTLQLPPSATVTVERGLRLSESVLRYLLIRGIIPFEGPRPDRDRGRAYDDADEPDADLDDDVDGVDDEADLDDEDDEVRAPSGAGETDEADVEDETGEDADDTADEPDSDEDE